MIPDTVPIRTRREAADLGLKKYWTGRPCRRDHHEMRYTVSGLCTACVRIAHDKYKPVRHPDGRVAVTVYVHQTLREAVVRYAEALEMARAMAPSTAGHDARAAVVDKL